MINPTPMLRPSPMDISGLFAGSFEALKRRFGLFILLSLAPSLLALAMFIAAAVVGGSAAITGNESAMITSLIIVVAIFAIGSLVVALAQLKMYGMMSQAAYEIAQGERPDFNGLMARTRGYLPRMMPVIALFFGIIIALYLLIGAMMWAMFNSVANGGDPTGAVLGIFGLLTLLTVVAVPVSIILWTKLLYLVPSVATEALGGMEALKRSWNLTKGSFWRTFGYAILPQLAVTAVVWMLNALGQVASGAFGVAMPRNPTPAESMAYLLALIPLFTITIVLQILVQLFTTPFIQSYYTYMFIDQVRRNEQPSDYGQFGYGQPGYPPAGPQPGQPYSYPQQPAPGSQPGQGPQYPGAPQQYPGQQYPGQQYPPQPGSSQNQWPGQS
ncbi:glycerophosphoryl diester phosphodiesterase membrane domain-containing protein [Micropruina sp.]|uniref:glycerophosphoryl diester phosphodiesterase membrane domain-containing protein n=1 Tax=Micropruina sp. TaxID=2737536 RepID=UPI0039E6258B